MGFSRSNIFAAAALTMIAFNTPSIAGSNDEGMMGDDGYGSGSGHGHGYGRMMDDRMMGSDGCPGWRMHHREGRDWRMMHRRRFGMMGGGYGQRGWMMRRFGGEMGPGMMYGYGGDEDENEMNLTVDQVKNYLNWMIRNPNLTVGDVKEKDAETIMAEIVTKQGNVLVQRLDFNRHSGLVRPEQQSRRTTGQGQNEPESQGNEENEEHGQRQQ